MTHALTTHWNRRGLVAFLLLPLSALYCLVIALRRRAYRWGLLRRVRLPVPVIVVGNLTVGGTGKTPLVIWLCEQLRAAGRRPGIVARGYGGRTAHWPQTVTPQSDPVQVGDEPVLLAQRCACPIVVAPDRVAAARALLARHDCDVLISDDGLQHYRLARDIEIAVIDGQRRFGNGFCLPAGPLREPHTRLQSVDLKVVNGTAQPGETTMQLQVHSVYRLLSKETRPLAAFAGRPNVHAVAGIGYPERFFQTLRAAGVQSQEHAFGDHHPFQPQDFSWPNPAEVLMTEKDGVKCRQFAQPNWWAVRVDAQPDERLAKAIFQLLKERARG